VDDHCSLLPTFISISPMMPRVFSWILASLLASTASSFSSAPSFQLLGSSLSGRVRHSAFLRTATTAGSNDGSPLNEKLMKALEMKEAKIDKERAAAMAKLSELEARFEEIQTKKREYLDGAQLAAKPVGGVFTETAARSAVKAFAWRIIAGSVTFVTSLRFSGSIATALSIVGSDFFSKSFTMFIGERLMNKSQAGRTSGSDGAGRSLAKALIWRLFAICNTLTMAIFIAKDLSIASKIAGSDAIFKTGLMYFYERVWARVDWGKQYDIDFAI
jgi:uncharacterized membrane protein